MGVGVWVCVCGGGHPSGVTECEALTAALSMIRIMLAFGFSTRLLVPPLMASATSSLPEDCRPPQSLIIPIWWLSKWVCQQSSGKGG